MSVKVRIKNGRLYLDVIENRKHYWESLHIKLSTNAADRKEQMRFAESCRAKRELQIAQGEWGFIDRLSGNKMLCAFMREMGKGKRGGAPINRCAAYIKRYGDIKITAVNQKWVSAFQEWLLSLDISKNTAHAYASVLRTALNRAVAERIIQASPAASVKNIGLPKTNMPVLSVEEVMSIASVRANTELQDSVRRAFVFACYTGLRVSDLKTLEWGHIENRNGIMWISKTQVKTKTEVEIPIHQTAWRLIQPHGFAGKVFPFLDNTGASRFSLSCIIKLAGIDKEVSWHTARRSAATIMLESGIDPFTIQRILGHSSINTTTLYAKSTDRLKAEAMSRLPDFTSMAEVG